MKLAMLDVDTKNNEFQTVYQLSPGSKQAQFDELIRRSWVYHDHAIEGVVLTKEEVLRGLEGGIGKDLCEDLLLTEIHRHYMAVNILREEAPDAFPIELAAIKRLHVLCSPLKDSTAGFYRKSEHRSGLYQHEVVPSRAISYRMRKLLVFINEEALQIHPILAAAKMHLMFMQSFPFEKRSGRTGRMLLNLWLLHRGYPLMVIPASERSEYYSAIKHHNLEALTKLFMKVLLGTFESGASFFAHSQSKTAAWS